MRAAWTALVLAALVVLLAAIGWGSLFFWANLHGPEHRTLYRHMVRKHALARSERRQVHEAMEGAQSLDSPRLRAAVVDGAGRARERDIELRREHPRWRVAIVVLYGLAALCAAAAVVPLFLDERTVWPLRLGFTFDAALVATWAGRPFLRRRNWRRAIDRNRVGPTAANE